MARPLRRHATSFPLRCARLWLRACQRRQQAGRPVQSFGALHTLHPLRPSRTGSCVAHVRQLVAVLLARHSRYRWSPSSSTVTHVTGGRPPARLLLTLQVVALLLDRSIVAIGLIFTAGWCGPRSLDQPPHSHQPPIPISLPPSHPPVHMSPPIHISTPMHSNPLPSITPIYSHPPPPSTPALASLVGRHTPS